MSIDSVMLSSHLILCHPLPLLPSIFPSIRVFSNELVLHIRWPKYSASASVLSVNIQDWFLLGLTGLISLLPKGPSRVFSSTAIWKHQFFGTQSSLWSNSLKIELTIFELTDVCPGTYSLLAAWVSPVSSPGSEPCQEHPAPCQPGVTPQRQGWDNHSPSPREHVVSCPTSCHLSIFFLWTDVFTVILPQPFWPNSNLRAGFSYFLLSLTGYMRILYHQAILIFIQRLLMVSHFLCFLWVSANRHIMPVKGAWIPGAVCWIIQSTLLWFALCGFMWLLTRGVEGWQPTVCRM